MSFRNLFTIYQEFLRSRHAAVSWAAIYGAQGLTAEQVSYAEKYHPGYANRPPHPFRSRALLKKA